MSTLYVGIPKSFTYAQTPTSPKSLNLKFKKGCRNQITAPHCDQGYNPIQVACILIPIYKCALSLLSFPPLSSERSVGYLTRLMTITLADENALPLVLNPHFFRVIRQQNDIFRDIEASFRFIFIIHIWHDRKQHERTAAAQIGF